MANTNSSRVCSVEGCDAKYYAKGHCRKHYTRTRRYGDPLGRPKTRLCSVEGCGQKHHSRGYCSKHYYRAKEYGDPEFKRYSDDCAVVGCGEPRKSLGYCALHYDRFKRHGDPNVAPKQTANPYQKESLPPLRLLQRKMVVSPDSGCWIWNGYRNPKGYGRYRYRGRDWSVHRTVFAHHNGDIPAGMLVCHSCDNPPCCNPDHLWLGTNKDNMRDASRKGRLTKKSA